MGEGMPYHLEKGPTLRIIEQALNGDGSRAGRCQILNAMRSATGLKWTDVIPGLWEDDRFHKPGVVHPRRVLRRDWFGYEEQLGDVWVPRPGSTTGYWIGYKGDVEGIVRGAVQWALELSLIENAGVGAVCQQGPRPLPIELFWKCPAPWFEAWVVRRPAGNDALVSVTFVTPSHRGANVAESPIATSDTTHAAGFAHPVPSTQSDYTAFTPPGANVALADDRARRYAMWVVTHGNHTADPNVREQFGNNSAHPGDFNDWGIPYLNVYKGTAPLVVVSPSLNAGGIRRTGDVP
jgi:hypothetical protein